MGNLSSDTLIIVIEGSGWMSVLGRRWMGIWLRTGMTAHVIQPLGRDHAFIVPEKWKRNPRSRSWINSGVYFENYDLRLLYTIENLIEMYAAGINTFLANNHFESIFLVGGSEGAIILPALYQQIYQREKIRGMVSFAGGGLSMYESVAILSTDRRTPRRVREMYVYVIENHRKDAEARLNSTGLDKYGNVLRWMTSTLKFHPFPYWKNINIPVLFLHGERDFNVAVESTRYIQENLPEKPFEFIFYRNLRHSPNPLLPHYTFQFHRIRNDIANWIRGIQNR
jgi:pimeloyl-ACP methyl ester carboxylesterase